MICQSIRATAIAGIINQHVPQAEIFMVKIFDHDYTIKFDDLYRALEYINENVNFDILNLSIGVTECFDHKRLENICCCLSQEGVLIVFPFMVIRKFAGGFHAKHAYVCMIVSTGLLGLCLYIVVHTTIGWIFHVLVIVAGISIIIHSPIDSENRRLSESEKKQYGLITGFLVMSMILFYVVLVAFHFEYYAGGVVISLGLTALLQFPCVLRQKLEK